MDIETCDRCGEKVDLHKLPDDEILTVTESRGEFWGAPCSELVWVGWICPHCGQEMRF